MNTKLPLSLLGLGLFAPSSLMAQNRPNIILFLVDDMGWQETSVPFYKEVTPLNQRYRTPNMERMAKLGVKFTQSYACAISSPSRCSLMSGMNAARHRVTNWTLRYNQKTDAHSSTIELPSWHYNGIQPAATATSHDRKNATLITSLPQVLKDNGYYTIHCGKAHFAAETTLGANPINMGFDVNIAGAANGAPASYLAEQEFGSGPMHVIGLEKYYHQHIFLTEALTREAIAALQKPIAAKKPFYLYMSHYAIHAPYNPDDRFTKHYQGVVDPQLKTQLNTNEINHAALVEGMDKSLGDILDFLQKNPEVAKNTIVLFMSDNGGQGVGPRQGRLNRDQNYPARGGKGSAYEGGVHEPMMVMWPNVVKGGTTNDNRVMIEDFFPSILDMAGIQHYQTVQHIDGKSFVDLLKNPNLKRDRVTIWHFPNLWGETQDRNEGYGAYSAIMKGDYHLIYFWETQQKRLYNIKEDIGEEHDLSATLPDVTNELSVELSDSLKAYDAQRPMLKATGKVIPWPDEAVEQVAPGSTVKPTPEIFSYSTPEEKHYYRIIDQRPAGSNGPFFWTLGKHNDYNAVQCSNVKMTGEEEHRQLFYFTPGKDARHFRIFTANDEKTDYLNGKTGNSWNHGNISSTETHPFVQYNTPQSGDFQLIASVKPGVYGIAYQQAILNDRGTGFGTAANMRWVINTYPGIPQTITDPGSQYRFEPVNSVVSGILLEQIADTPMTLEDIKRDDLPVYQYNGCRMKDVNNLSAGIYIVKKAGKYYKLWLQ